MAFMLFVGGFVLAPSFFAASSGAGQTKDRKDHLHFSRRGKAMTPDMLDFEPKNGGDVKEGVDLLPLSERKPPLNLGDTSSPGSHFTRLHDLLLEGRQQPPHLPSVFSRLEVDRASGLTYVCSKQGFASGSCGCVSREEVKALRGRFQEGSACPLMFRSLRAGSMCRVTVVLPFLSLLWVCTRRGIVFWGAFV